MLSPVEFGLPSKFTHWRPGQLDAIERIINGTTRFTVICAPTGFGKSIVYMAAARMYARRTVVLTSTKGLQDQLQADFGSMPGVVDIRGQSNYECIAVRPGGELATPGVFPQWTSVEWGPCHYGCSCSLRVGRGCEYYDRCRQAQQADIVVANYAMWMHDAYKKEDDRIAAFNPVEILILDEAHDAPGVLADWVGAEIRAEDVARCRLKFFPPTGEDMERWKDWGGRAQAELKVRLQQEEESIRHGGHGSQSQGMKEAQLWRRMERKMARVAGAKGEWVAEQGQDWEGRKSVRFDPVSPEDYAESGIFRGVKRVILVSATVRPKTAQLLGIPSQQMDFHEYQSTFPVSSRPIIHVPTVQMNHRAEQDDLKMGWMIGAVDRIVARRGDRKGIIHTVSYKRAQLISGNSSQRSRMLSHTSRNRAEVVQTFKLSSSPSVLISPSVDTGYDFPYKECEFQIIVKVPFLDNRARIIKRRMERDREFSDYMTAQTLVQMTGRGMRAQDDRCETLILDDNIMWWLNRNVKHFPKWWLDSVLLNGPMDPEPLPLLPRLNTITSIDRLPRG